MKPTSAITLLAILLALSLHVTTSDARTWYIKADGSGDLPTIQTAIDSVLPGDVILVAAGRYTWANQGGSPPEGMIHIPRTDGGWVLRSESGAAATILDAQSQNRVMFANGNDTPVVIDGFTFTNGRAPTANVTWGGGLALGHSVDFVRNCIFEYNEAQDGGGLFTGGTGTARIENCVFRNNTAVRRGGGVLVAYTQVTQTIVDCQFYNNTADQGGGLSGVQATLSVENTVLAGNTANTAGGGFYGQGMWGLQMNGCTVSSNWAPDGAGLYFFAGGDLSLQRTIFGFHTGGGLISLVAGATPSFSCCDLFGNFGGDALPVGAIDAGDNIYVDPVFCNPPWSPEPILSANSGCLPGNHPDGASCGGIGARLAGCNAVSVEPRSWGQVKAMYRDAGTDGDDQGEQAP